MIHVELTLGGSWSSGNDTESGVNCLPGNMPESVRERANGNNTFNTKDDDPTRTLETTYSKAVSVTVGSPRRFGNPVGSSKDTTKLQETPEDAATDLAKLRHMLKKVRVNEASLYTAIERLGGGGKGLKAVIDYIIQFQGLEEQNAECVGCDLFSDGLEELCLKSENENSEKEVHSVHTTGHYHNKSVATFQSTTDENSEKEARPLDTTRHYQDNVSSACWSTIDLERHQATADLEGHQATADLEGHQATADLEGHQATADLERQQMHNSMSHGLGMAGRPVGWNSQGQENWSHGGHYVDPRRVGMVDHPPFVGAFFPSFYCPYPPPYAGYMPFNPCVQPIFVPFMAGPNVCPPSVENSQSAAIIRASRKIRIAKHRGNINGHQQIRPTAATGSGSPISGVQRKSQAQLNLPLRTAEQGQSTGQLKFLLHKELKPSDVSSLGRTVLPKKEAESHLPYLTIREGITIPMVDFDTGQSWTFRYRFWPNNKSRMYILENTRDFMKARNLQEGDLLLLYRNAQGGYVVQGKKSASKSGSSEITLRSAEDEISIQVAALGEEQRGKKQRL